MYEQGVNWYEYNMDVYVYNNNKTVLPNFSWKSLCLVSTHESWLVYFVVCKSISHTHVNKCICACAFVQEVRTDFSTNWKYECAQVRNNIDSKEISHFCRILTCLSQYLAKYIKPSSQTGTLDATNTEQDIKCLMGMQSIGSLPLNMQRLEDHFLILYYTLLSIYIHSIEIRVVA